MEVIGTERNLDRAVEGAKELRPDVVIANSRGPALDPVVQRLLAEGITPVVIVLNAADNHLRIYRSDRSEEREISQIEELEQVIRSE